MCLRNQGKVISNPSLQDLSEVRVSKGPSFFNTGVDFAGPLYTRDTHNNGEHNKVYVRVFTCELTQAVATSGTNTRIVSHHVVACF